MMKLRTFLIMVMTIGAILPLITFQIFSINQEQTFIEHQVISKLEDIAKIQHERIKQQIREEKHAVQLIKSRTKLRQLIQQANFRVTDELAQQITKILNDVTKASSEINSISIYNNNRELLSATSLAVENSINHKTLSLVTDTPPVQVLKYRNSLLLDLFEPIYLNEVKIGFISVMFYANHINEIVADFTGLGLTGETVLAGRNSQGDALFLTPTRHAPDIGFNLTISKENENIPITHAMNGVSATLDSYVDYRNEPVVAISHHIPEADWGLIVKMDKSEAYEKISYLTKQNIKATISIIVILLIAIWFISKKLSSPLVVLESLANNAEKGNRKHKNIHFKIKELNSVSNSFTKMLRKVNESEDFLHDSIKELTELNSKLFSEAERFKRWKESNFIGIIHSDSTGNILDANSAMLNMIGYSKKELIDGEIDWKNLTPKEFIHLDEKAIAEANIKGYWTPFEKVYRHKDGHHVPILVGGSIFKESTQEFIVFIVDLTEKYKQLTELEKYKGIIENSEEAFAFVNNNYIFQTVNQAYLDLHNTTRDKIIGQKVPDILGVEFFESKLKHKIDKALDGNVVSFTEVYPTIKHGDVTQKVTYTPYFNELGHLEGFIFKGENITELAIKQHQIELKDAEQKHIIASMLEGVFTADDKGTVLSFNPEAEHIFGYQADEVVGKNVKMLVADNMDHDAKIANYLITKKSTFIDNRLGRDVNALHKDGHVFPIRLAIAQMPLNEDGELHFIANCQDLTKFEEQRELLDRSLKLESLGKVAGGVAHDFNNILGIVLGYIELISSSETPKTEYINAIQTACERGSKLTKSLLTFAKSNNDSATFCNINQIIENNLGLIQTSITSKILINKRLSKAVDEVKIEANLFEDLLLNMSINAMHAMPNGGTLTITTQNVNLPEIEAMTIGLPKGHYVEVYISDDGCGISEENINKVFDPFFTTKDDIGNGLGLSQCYGFLKASGGTITVQSQPNIGTQFRILIPSVKQTPYEDLLENQLATHPATLSNFIQTALVLDDEEDFRFLNKTFLEGEGITVIVCTSPKEALVQIQNKNIDIVLTDMIMPEMTGKEFISNVHKIKPSMTHLYVSGFTNSKGLTSSEKENILFKPYNREDLIQKILSLYQ